MNRRVFPYENLSIKLKVDGNEVTWHPEAGGKAWLLVDEINIK